MTASLPDRLRKAADELESLRCAEDAALMREAAEYFDRLVLIVPGLPGPADTCAYWAERRVVLAEATDRMLADVLALA